MVLGLLVLGVSTVLEVEFVGLSVLIPGLGLLACQPLGVEWIERPVPSAWGSGV